MSVEGSVREYRVLMSLGSWPIKTVFFHYVIRSYSFVYYFFLMIL